MLQNAADVLGEGSGHRHRARPPVSAEIRALVSRMAAANPLGGAPRIPGELLKVCRMLGLEFRAARSRFFQDGMGLGPVKMFKARHRPASRRREHGRARG